MIFGSVSHLGWTWLVYNHARSPGVCT